MKIFKRWITIILIVIIIILIFYSVGKNSKHTIYIEEDRDQFTSIINTLINNSKSKIEDITSSKDKNNIIKDIEILNLYLTNIEKNIFYFERKIYIIDKKIGSEFENLSANIKYKGETNLEDINLYYESLLESIDSEQILELEEEHKKKFEEINNFYNEIHKKINAFIEKNM